MVTLPIKKEWFDKIKSGEKTTELETTRHFDCTLKRLEKLCVATGFEKEQSTIIYEVKYVLDDHEGLTKLYRLKELEYNELRNKLVERQDLLETEIIKNKQLAAKLEEAKGLLERANNYIVDCGDYPHCDSCPMYNKGICEYLQKWRQDYSKVEK